MDIRSCEAVKRRITKSSGCARPISLLFSFLNPEHEQRLAARLRDAFPDLPIYLSSDVLPEIKEFERTSTTAVCAYVGPILASYIARLDQVARDRRLPQLYLMASNGGLLEPAETIAVSGITIDSFVGAHGTGPVDAMKIDTEGTEDKVLRGARRSLERDRPIIICEVLHGLTEPALHALLDPLDYSYFISTRQGPIAKPRIEGDPTYTHLNYLMVAKDRAEQVLAALHIV